MLKTISYEYIDKEDDLTDERYKEIRSLFKEYNGKLFKWDNDERIYFKEGNESAIKEVLKATGFKSETIEQFIEWFDGGEDLKINHNIIVHIRDCITELQEVINDDKIINRLLNSDNVHEEINILIKEQAYKVFLRYVNKGFEKINNGNFKWE